MPRISAEQRAFLLFALNLSQFTLAYIAKNPMESQTNKQTERYIQRRELWKGELYSIY